MKISEVIRVLTEVYTTTGKDFDVYTVPAFQGGRAHAIYGIQRNEESIYLRAD